ncbi:hypothetical protein SAMN05216464_108100 [Mucilaginibacter pineti]|uniref:Helix-turn-helix n=1 Tax=Mucilaginibacter pineti TaxID=1391627 RepID=A0A1G7ENG8_9SPHI|nr:helix-turn-helix transcriptional regulator [Mucilaginibacter pineti]SDE65233.1 hypothetical protein SAMN05216464_108100 [Mucilaginibacter pineti]
MEKKNKKYQVIDISKFSDDELADAFIFSQDNKPVTEEDKQADKEFWANRRKEFENRSPREKIFSKLLQLKFQLEDYIGSNDYKESLNFGYFLNEYVSRQDKKDKEFASEVDVTPAVLSQYINNHRKPKDEFVIRLELHSNGMIPALSWFKLVQKDKEHEIKTNSDWRRDESKHVKNRIEMLY